MNLLTEIFDMKDYNNLFELRASLDKLEVECGMAEWSTLERAIYSFISNHKNANINLITKTQYFSNISLSTITRTVNNLQNSGLISRTQSENDRRVVYLSTCVITNNTIKTYD